MKKSTVLKVVGGVTVIAATTAVVIKCLPKIKETISNLTDVLNFKSTIEDDDFEDEEDLFESEDDFKIEPEDDENTFVKEEDVETNTTIKETTVSEEVKEAPVVEEMKIKPRTMDLDDEQVDLED